MKALIQLTIANIRSFTRDRAALFWTLAFPLIFVVLFGSIFSGGGNVARTFGWVDLDLTSRSAELKAAFAAVPDLKLSDDSEQAALAAMRDGKADAVIVIPAGYGAQVDTAASQPGTPASITVYTDPSQTQTKGAVYQIVGSILGQVNLSVSGRGPAVVPKDENVQTENLNFISYLVPSILGMAVMQLGIFSAVPLVADREKLILKRLNATPLRRWQLVGSNVLMRLLISVIQTVIIIGVGAGLYGVQLAGNPLLIGALIVLGSLAFIALGYVIASFATTEDSAQGMTSVVQFPLMFLSGTFFPIDSMPEYLKTVARVMPLTYLGDALRQVMVHGTPFAPLWVCFAVLAGFLVVCFGIAARFFRWQ
jgi:ABC-2 type transport system permease protein